jgi:uncharacterized membrane protein
MTDDREAAREPVAGLIEVIEPVRDAPVRVHSTRDERRATRQMLGVIFVAAGIAHLIHRGLYRSLVPGWLQTARTEIDVATGALELTGGVLLFIPKLRNVARWTNLALLAPVLPAMIDEARHPMRLRSFGHTHMPGLAPIGPTGRAVSHSVGAVLLLWATGPDRVEGSAQRAGRLVQRGVQGLRVPTRLGRVAVQEQRIVDAG